jgi:hypothetical protein
MNGIYYIAVRSPRGRQKFLWSTMRVKPTAADTRIEACEVPYHIRRQAYRYPAKKMLMQTSCKPTSREEPGLVAYKCPSCRYVTSFLAQPSRPDGANDGIGGAGAFL